MAISVHTPKAASYTPGLLKINRAVSKESSRARLVLPTTEINVSHAVINGVAVAQLLAHASSHGNIGIYLLGDRTKVLKTREHDFPPNSRHFAVHLTV